VVTGLAVDDAGFEVLASGERVGSRRSVGPADAEFLTGLAGRYVRGVQAGGDDGVFVGLGRELFDWLEGDQGQLSGLLERVARPVVFEVAGPRSPSDAAWAVLRAPFELLALPGGGLLAQDELARFCVVRRMGPELGRPGLDQFRLGLAFMASSPRDQRELDFEAEEAAILAAAGESNVDLLVEDTGEPEQLAGRLAAMGGMPVVHLSCHGLNNWSARPGPPGVPVLMMEDDTGRGRPVTAGDLAGLLTAVPRLLVVSACLTATGADAGGLPPGDGGKAGSGPRGGGLVAHSLATALVAAGFPAVIGWDGSVEDRSATVFAERLYWGLAGRADLAVAVGDARRVLLGSKDPAVRADWHLARLWLGPAGGGPLVAGRLKRSLVTATHGTKTFLDRKQQVPVAAAQMFVGRRPELQASLRALRSGERAGVLLHGQGRLGKSSLAARVADRCPDMAVAVVFGEYGALAILDAVSMAVRANPAARDLLEARLPQVRQRPEAIESVMVDLLTGPCAQAGDGGQRPLLLIIDDLEQILVPDPSGPHKVAPGYAGVLAGVLGAFDPAETDSRLLVTSRFTFILDGLQDRLEPVQLPPLSPVAQRKLQRRQQALTPPDQQAERAGLAARALAVSRGNPGLQDLVGLRLVYGELVGLERAEAAVAGMEAYLRQGDLPADVDVRAFLENLALDTLLQEAGPSNTALLRAATLFAVPVPEPVIAELAGQVGGSPGRLRGLGLLDPYPDLYDPARLALTASPLAAGRIDPLSPGEQGALAAVSTGPLLAAWGGPAPGHGRDAALDLQLTRLALLADDPEATAACAPSAVTALRSGPAPDAFRLGQDAIALLDRHGDTVPLALLRRTADAAALTTGTGQADEAVTLYTRALQLNPEDAQAWYGRGKGFASMGDFGHAVESYRASLDRVSDFFWAWYDLGLAQLELRDFAQAADSLRRAQLLRASDHKTSIARARALRGSGDLTGAYIEYQSALALRPNATAALRGRDEMLSLLPGPPPEPVGLGAEPGPDDHEAWFRRGNVLLSQGKAAEAARAFRAALDSRENYADAWYGLGLACMDGTGPEDPVACYERALSIDPYFYWAHFDLGNVRRIAGDHEDALGHYDKAIGCQREFADAWYGKGLCLAGLGRHREAVQHYEQALQLEPDFPAISYDLGNSLRELGYAAAAAGDRAAAEDFFRQGVAAYQDELGKGDHAGASHGLGLCCIELGRYQDAVAYLDQAIDADPDAASYWYDAASYWYDKGRALSDGGRHGDAVAAFRRALELRSPYPQALYEMARAEARQGHVGKAVEALEASAKLRPERYPNKARTDPAFAAILGDRRFLRLVENPPLGPVHGGGQ
jgi:tetratricopeptide (TPR) repeat protein